MMNALDWMYEKRDFVSYTSALLLASSFVLILQYTALNFTQNEDRAMTAFLEEVAQPEVNKPTEPIKKIVEKVQVSKPQEVPLFKPVSSPFATVDAPKDIKQLEPSASLEKPHVSQPTLATSAPPPQVVSQPIAPTVAGLYEAQLRAYLERIKRYPTSREARLTRPQGAVRVWLEISRQGQLLGLGILSSSGSNLLDGEALKTMRNGTFPVIPDEAFVGESSHKFSATLSYTLEGQ